MDSFEDRKKSEEAKAAHRAEMAFKAEARRNKLLGLWVAEQLEHDDPDAYVGEVIAAIYGGPGHVDVLTKVMGDLEAAGIPVDENFLRAKHEELLSVAHEQLMGEGSSGA